MFDFSTLYTNFPLDVIYDSLRSLIIKCLQIVVNSNRKKKHADLMDHTMLGIENIQLTIS